MGLLDPTDDPGTMGLLSLGMGLLGSKGSFGNALSQAGPQALQAMRQVQMDKQRKEQMAQAQQMQQLQMQQAQMAIAQQQAAQQRQAQADNMRGGFLNSIDPSAGPAMEFNPAAAMRAGLSAPEIEMLAPQARKPLIVGKTVLDPVTMKPLYQEQDKPEKDPEAIRVLKMIHGENTPAFAAAMADYGRKMTTHAPAASAVSYGSPVPIMMPDGSIGYAQPGNKAGAAPQVMAGPDGKPLVKPPGAEKDPSEGERKAATLLQRLRGSQAQLSSALKNSPDAAKPSAVVEAARRYAGDAPANVITPAARQQVEAAQLDILDAALTLGTGAAYTREQLEGYRRSYFPQIGDDPPTVRDKQARLKNVIDAAEIAAGRAAKNVPAFPATNGCAFDPEKERRYQEWKRKQGQ